MLKTILYLWILIVLFLFPVIVSAQEDVDITRLTIQLVDIKTGNNITNFPVEFSGRHKATGTIESDTQVSDQSGLIWYALTPGNWEIGLSADNVSTDAIDHYTNININIQPNEPELKKTAYLRPVGDIEGVVYDDDKNLVLGADLLFKCVRDTDIASKTNNFGAFKAQHLPVGQCTVSAAYEGAVGTEIVIVEKGSLVTIAITLDKNIASSISWGYFIIIAVIAALIVGFFILYKSKKDSKGVVIETSTSETEEPEMEVDVSYGVEEISSPEDLNPRARDILKTLNDKENKIVEFLVSNKNMATQATIRNNTGIPKTSLARDLGSLEQKKVIAIEKIGKMKKVTLTDWFLGKD